MNNLSQHLSHQSSLFIIGIISLVLILISIPYFLQQEKIYGSMFEFASTTRKFVLGLSCFTLTTILIYGFQPYSTPPTDQLAFVIGNTQNTPAPKISNDISDSLIKTLLLHKGDNADEIAGSIKIVSAVKHPVVVDLDASSLSLRKIGNNSSNAKRSAEIDANAIQDKINKLIPTDNGSNYLEAILEARDNVKEGSKIIVIGSGLSDSGDLNFSKSNILTSEQQRNDVIRSIKSKYGFDYLDNYDVEFYGLGDTTKPQQPLSNKQKEVVRTIYQDVIRGLGGDASVVTSTLVGSAVKTNYVVGTTDTGCGDIGLVFDDENLNFVTNQATLTDPTSAKASLATIKTLWDKYSSTIGKIQIDGYIAHYPGPGNLSQQRADLVKNVLVNLGVPGDKVGATGRGYGPYPQDAQNRMVKVTISRSSDQCLN